MAISAGRRPIHEPISKGSAAVSWAIGSSSVPSLPERMTSTSPLLSIAQLIDQERGAIEG